MGQQFYPSRLTPLKKQYSLKNFTIVDFETNRWADYEDIKDMTLENIKQEWHDKPIKPFLICFYDPIDNTEKYFEGKNCRRDFLKFYMTKKYRNRPCFAHNGGQFDFTSLYETLCKDKYFHKYIPKIIYVNGGIMILRLKDKHKNVWKFQDSLYMLKDSLENLCDSFHPKTRKIKMPPYPYKEHREAWIRYCMSDCKALAEILQTFNNLIINEIGGCMGATTSSIAMRTFRYKYLKYDLPTYFTWNNFIRKGLHGGRTEAFIMYAPLSKYRLYDVNSMYPSVMRNNIFPISTPKRVNYRDAWDCAGKCGFMECDIRTPDYMHIPLLPYHDYTNNGKLLFPLGEWRAIYEFSLIEKALKLGYKITPHRTIEFEGDYLFTEYADDVYKIKRNSPKKSAMYKISKLLGNGLFGKFGERSEREEIITDDNANIVGTYPIPNDTMGYTTRKFIRYCAHHMPAVSARVTALAQIKLYEGFEMIMKRKGRVFYCDTDSMVTDIEMNDSKELGGWGLEREITRGVFLAPKAYCYEYIDEKGEIQIIQKLKGFTKDFKKTLHFEDFEKALPPNNDFSAFNEPRVSPASFKEIQTRKLSGFGSIVKPRSIRHVYDKRQFFDDYTTKPLTILDKNPTIFAY